MLALVAAALSFSSAPAECACNPTTTSLDHSQNENTKVATAGGCVKEHFQEGAAEVVWCDTDVANGKWGVCGEIDGGLYEALEAGYGPGASPPGGFTGKNVCPGKAAAPVVEVRSSVSLTPWADASYWPHTCASRSAQVTTVYVNGTYSSFSEGAPEMILN